jgi:hypothetical protein
MAYLGDLTIIQYNHRQSTIRDPVRNYVPVPLVANSDNLERPVIDPLEPLTSLQGMRPWYGIWPATPDLPTDGTSGIVSFPVYNPTIPMDVISQKEMPTRSSSQSKGSEEVGGSRLEVPFESYSYPPSSDNTSSYLSKQSSVSAESLKSFTAAGSTASYQVNMTQLSPSDS